MVKIQVELFHPFCFWVVGSWTVGLLRQQLSKKPDNSAKGLIRQAEAEAEVERGSWSSKFDGQISKMTFSLNDAYDIWSKQIAWKFKMKHTFCLLLISFLSFVFSIWKFFSNKLFRRCWASSGDSQRGIRGANDFGKTLGLFFCPM